MEGSNLIDLLLFAGVAVFLMARLWKMLGSNHENDERPDQSSFRDMADNFTNEAKAPKKESHSSAKQPQHKHDNDFINADIDVKTNRHQTNDHDDDEQQDQNIILNQYDDKIKDTLLQMMAIDGDFTPQAFLDGATQAYDMIISAYAEENIGVLENLISKNIMNDFAAAIKTRDDAGEDMDITIIGIEQPKILECALNGTMASIMVSISSRQTMVVYDKERNIIEGDQHHVEDCVDHWTFERDLTNDDPAWYVVATHHESHR